MVITLPCLARFPLAVTKHGGVSFLVAYTMVLVIIGFPSLYLQHNLARLEQKGPVQLWYSLVPLAGGLGTALASLSLLMSVQYSVITSYSLLYLMASFYSPLPWTQCSTWWGADTNCQVQNYNVTHRHGLSDFLTEIEESLKISLPVQHAIEEPYQQFWFKYVLQLNSDGNINTRLVWSLSGLWLLLAVTVLPGSKVVLTRLQGSLLFLLVCLTMALAIKLSTLPGIGADISSLLKPNWSSLANTTCWLDAVLLSSISANIHTGTVQAVASYSSSRRDHSLALLLCLAVHLLACSAWSVLSLALAGDTNRQETGLFPLTVLGQAISQVSGGQVWCQAWYSLTTTLGILSVVSSLAAPLSFIQSMHSKLYRYFLLSMLLVICLLVSLTCALPTGFSILSLLTRWGIYLPSLLLGTAITTTISLTYGLSRATDRIAAQDGCKMHLLLLRYLQLAGIIFPLVMDCSGLLITFIIAGQLLVGALLAIILSVGTSSRPSLSWRELLGSRTVRTSRKKLGAMPSLTSSYRNFERCDITMMTELGTPSVLRPCNGSGVVNRRLSLSPRFASD